MTHAYTYDMASIKHHISLPCDLVLPGLLDLMASEAVSLASAFIYVFWF